MASEAPFASDAALAASSPPPVVIPVPQATLTPVQAAIASMTPSPSAAPYSAPPTSAPPSAPPVTPPVFYTNAPLTFPPINDGWANDGFPKGSTGIRKDAHSTTIQDYKHFRLVKPTDPYYQKLLRNFFDG